MNLSTLPTDLPVPQDDGAARHLVGLTLPAVTLQATNGGIVNLEKLQGRHVIYIYPMTGQQNVALPDGWDAIPGARGCTPQSCSFANHFAELQELNAGVFGLSSQTTDYQSEAKTRLHLPFEILSDSALLLQSALNLPTFNLGKLTLYKRLTLIADNNKIVKVFYPVFPPDKNIDDVLSWLKANS